jgi:hypothetical protein
VRFGRDRIVQITGAVVLVALLTAVIWSLLAPDGPTDDRDAASTTATAAGQPTLALTDVEHLDQAVGRRVVADRAEVESVPGDEGFWVTTGGEAAWVQLTTAGESPYTVKAGDRVSFTGQVVAHGADFAERPEFSEADARRLVDTGAHIEVPVGDVRLES